MGIFEEAARRKIRFSHKGTISVEDLWDLDVFDLDRIFKGLNAKSKVCKEESLLKVKDRVDSDLDLQIAIIKRVVEVKLAEAEAKEAEAEKRQKKQKIMEIYAAKKDEALKNLPIEDLEKMLNEL